MFSENVCSPPSAGEQPCEITWGEMFAVLPFGNRTVIETITGDQLKTAFLIGFQIYLPFVILDLVVASVTIGMGMLMLPPVFISLPFKLLLFVLVDGWHLVIGMLMDSFA